MALVIRFAGIDDLGDLNKLRGEGKGMTLVIVDEMQDLRDEVLVPLMDDVLPFCLFDVEGAYYLP